MTTSDPWPLRDWRDWKTFCVAVPPKGWLQQFCLVRRDHVEAGHPHQNYCGLAWFDDGEIACRKCCRNRVTSDGEWCDECQAMRERAEQRMKEERRDQT